MVKTKRDKQQEKIIELSHQIDNAVESISYSAEDILDLIKFKALFPEYSLKNTLLIQSQTKGKALAVQSYRQWQNDNIHVQQGQKALYIFAPVFLKEVYDKDGSSIGLYQKLNERQKEEVNRNKDLYIFKDKMVGYRAVPVFDIQQTDAPIDYYPNIYQKHYRISEHDYSSEFLEALRKITENRDVHMTNVPSIGLSSSTNGYFSPDKKEIYVSASLSPDDQIATWVHELAHSQMHLESKLSTEEQEYQAELVAGVVCEYFGIESVEQSSLYIKGYIKGEKEMSSEDRFTLLEETIDTSTMIISELENILERDYGYQGFKSPLQDIIDHDITHPVQEEKSTINDPSEKEIVKNLKESDLVFKDESINDYIERMQ